MLLMLTAELNRGLTGPSSFIWYHTNPARGDPIVELNIVHDGESCPEEFEMIARDMLQGSEQSAYLCFRRSKDVDPINEIRILYNESSPPDDSFSLVVPPVYSNPSDSTSINIIFSTISKGEDPSIAFLYYRNCDTSWCYS